MTLYSFQPIFCFGVTVEWGEQLERFTFPSFPQSSAPFPWTCYRMDTGFQNGAHSFLLWQPRSSAARFFKGDTPNRVAGLLPLSPGGGQRIGVWYGLVRSPPTASLQLGCLPRLVRVRSLRGLCRLPPPGDPDARDCPGALDARSRAAVPMCRRAERHIAPSDYLSAERALFPVLA